MAEPANHLYTDKSAEYFTRARTEIEPLLPASGQALRVLEVGCSQGHTLDWLKKTGRASWTAGVEPYAELRVDSVDQFSTVDIEKALPEIAPESLDVILCLDVLEHLVNPWDTVRRLDGLLKPGGQWIISVPNLRNYHVVMDLAFKGRFEYTESGIMDRTHLRFFTRASAVALAESAGARVSAVLGTETNRWQKRLMSRLGLGDLLAKQFILAARKP